MADNLPDFAWRSTFIVQRPSQDIGNTFQLTPMALLLGFEQPKLYERFERPTPNHAGER